MSTLEPLDDTWKLAAKREEWGEGVFGVCVYVKVARELSNRDELYFSRMVDDATEQLRIETKDLDPATDTNRRQYEQEFRKCFEDAGLAPIFMERIPNEYCSRSCCMDRPWFVVTSRIGHIKIGWRKSVIMIDWSRSIAPKVGEKLFATEGVTVSRDYVHAWGYEKATSYLRQLGQQA